MKTFFKLFSLKYILPTLVVVVAGLVMIRLGFWQLDRLEQRRASNEPLIKWVNAEPLVLDNDTAIKNVLVDDYLMEYRLVQVTGTYDFENQIVLRLRQYRVNAGVSLVTPLLISGTDQMVFVERGWIPQEDLARENWSKYDELGEVTVVARIRLSQDDVDFGNLVDPTLAPGEERLDAFFVANVDRIAEQAGLEVIPGIYLIQIPDAAWTQLPFRSETEIEITEGPHFGYAIQWFIFALILYVGYPIYVYGFESGKIRVEEN